MVPRYSLRLLLFFMILLSWNIRGLDRGEKRRVIRSLVYRHKPEVFFIQKSKLKVFNSSVVRKLGGSWLTRVGETGYKRGVLKRLSNKEKESLEVVFSLKEVWLALSSCDSNKAPGQDGLNLNFIKAHWGEIQNDFMNFINDFNGDPSIVKKVNHTFIALIPKISLVGSMYKILANVLSNRIKRLVSDLKINFHKSCLVRVGKDSVSDPFPRESAFRYNKENFPITYLGLPLGIRPLAKSLWNPIIKKIEIMLSPWKTKFVSISRRRLLFDWEKEQWAGFQTFLSGNLIYIMSSDAFAWNLNQNGKNVFDSVSILMLNLKLGCVESKRVKKSVIKDWVLPLMSSFKFNVDGSVRGQLRQARMGGVLRNSNGKVVCLFSYFVGTMDSNAAEILAIHKEIEICSFTSSLHGQMVSIVSDSKVVVSWIYNKDFRSIIHMRLISFNRMQLKSHEWLEVVYASVMYNSFADSLAKIGAGSNGDFLHLI
ncbi:hypothetical protein Ddye_005148 [Dipteronia dyeriana]|uniref:RNase H type-1 domain-containing protein n=1 Tax=Dipteronia dyeriana TaxID=168575 RepID=A0AAE0CPC4_9ROSI|nr:hypothetical protein Ddye_005148 [Dipteronia dyeriana]